MNEALVMHVLRRHGALRRLPLVLVGVRGIVAHHAELRVPPLLAVRSQRLMARVAILSLHCFSSGYRLLVSDREVSDNVKACVSLTFFGHCSIGAFDLEQPVALNPDRPRTRGLRRDRIVELLSVYTVSERQCLPSVFGDRRFVIDRRPSEHEGQVIHLRSVDRFPLLVLHAECDNWIAPRPAPFDLQ